MNFNQNELLNNIDIVDLFEFAGIELKLIGKEYHGKCPFHTHSGNTALSINRDKKLWYCFKCKTGGNIIKFFMLYKNCSYYTALDILEAFYHHARLKKTSFEIYQRALKIIDTINAVNNKQKKIA